MTTHPSAASPTHSASTSVRASRLLMVGLAIALAGAASGQTGRPVHPAQSAIQQHYDAAFRFQNAGDLAHANAEYTLFLSAALDRIANGRANLGDYAHAAPLYQEAARITPHEVGVKVDFAAAALGASDWKTAKAQAASALAELSANGQPPNKHAVSVLAHALSSLEEHPLALEQFKTAAHLDPSFETFADLGMAYLMVGDAAGAAKVLSDIPARFGDDAALHMKLGIVYGQTKLFDQAIGEFNKAIAKDPRLKGAHYSLGASYMMAVGAGGYDKAEAEFRKELVLDPGNALVYAPLGRIALDRQKLVEAEADFKRAIALDQQSTTIYLSLGQIYMQTGRNAEAEAAFRKAIALSPDPARNDYEVERAHYWLGRLLQRDGAQEEAHKQLDRSRDLLYLKEQRTESRMGGGKFVSVPLEKTRTASPAAVAAEKTLEKQAAPSIASSYDNLGVNAANAGDFAGASSYFEQAAVWNPALPGINNYWARAAFAARQYGRAVEPFTRALKEHPADQPLRGMLGLSLLMVHRYADALETLRPLEGESDANLNLALTCAGAQALAGDYTQGVERLESLEKANPSNSLAHFLLGEAYSSRQQFSRSADELHTALSMDPGNSDVKSALALADEALGRKQEALELLSALADAGSQDADFYARLARLQLELASAKDAVGSLETAVRLSPLNASYHQQLADAYRQNGQPEDADRELHQAQLLQAQGNS